MFKSKEEFLAVFQLEDTEYYDPIFLNDTKFGFSIKRKYPSDIAYKPPLTRDGEPDNVAVLWIILKEEAKRKDGKIPLTVRISNYSLSKVELYGYDDNDETNKNQPTEEAVEESKKTPKPFAMEFADDFFYDPATGKFYLDKNNKPVDCKCILNKAFQDHCDSIHPIKGLELKFKNFMRNISIKVLDLLIGALKFTLKHILREKVTDEDIYDRKKSGDIEIEAEETLDVFGYKASKGTFIIFALLVVILSFASYYKVFEPAYFKHIFNDQFLVITHSIFALFCIELLKGPSITFIQFIVSLLKRLKNKLLFLGLNPFSYRDYLPILAVLLLIVVMVGLIWFGTYLLAR